MRSDKPKRTITKEDQSELCNSVRQLLATTSSHVFLWSKGRLLCTNCFQLHTDARKVGKQNISICTSACTTNPLLSLCSQANLKSQFTFSRFCRGKAMDLCVTQTCPAEVEKAQTPEFWNNCIISVPQPVAEKWNSNREFDPLEGCTYKSELTNVWKHILTASMKECLKHVENIGHFFFTAFFNMARFVFQTLKHPSH